MDLRSIINDDAPKAQRISGPSSQASPPPQSPAHGYFAHQNPPQISPPAYPPKGGPPTPLSQYPPQHDIRPPSSSGSGALHTQYSPRPTPTGSYSGNQYPFPSNHRQSPAPPPHLQSHGSRDSHSSIPPSTGRSFTHHSPVLNSPIGPPATTSGVYQPHLHHSLSRPSPTPTPNSLRDPTPQSIRGSPLSASSHPSGHTIPPQHPSMPTTPLGPPPQVYPRASVHGFREPISPPTTHQRTLSGASFGANSSIQSASPPARSVTGPVTESPQAYMRQSSERASHGFTDSFDRERSISVSPKTRVPSQSQLLDQRRSESHDQWGHQVAQVPQENHIEKEHLASGTLQTPITPGGAASLQMSSATDTQYEQAPLSHVNAPIDGHRNSLFQSPERAHSRPTPPERSYSNQVTQDSNSAHFHRSRTNDELYQRAKTATAPGPIPTSGGLVPTPGAPSFEPPPSSANIPSSSESTNGHFNPGQHSMPGTLQSRQTPLSQDPPNLTPPVKGIKREASTIESITQPVRKRLKFSQTPIWAQRHEITSRLRKQHLTQSAKQERNNPRHKSRSTTPMVTAHITNGDVNGVKAQTAQRDFEESNDGPLGYWERSITNIEPFNDVSRVVTDFIYHAMIERPDIDTGSIGGLPSPNGQLEIEAKLGRLVDRRSKQRLHLPVMSSVVLESSTKDHLMFESSMTEQQHKALNEFLNAEVQKSHRPPPPGQPPRAKIAYQHKRERDSFAQLTQAGELSLPPLARNLVEGNGKTKVRITKDQKTGRELARIVKCRLEDLDIHCPREAFDIRISINLEVTFQGDLDESTADKYPVRMKDRLSYHHQAYQIDLTQVSDGAPSGEKTHELEIEVSSAEVRKQIQLIKEEKDNEMERLIKVFLDNVKVLSRAIPFTS
ncbi:MAG: mRNA-capping enzyme subunit beta [Bogoriella megaspora]|nr:MAG: mRNA-capping enzyme subunit beta [Bogoriella megaspora]